MLFAYAAFYIRAVRCSDAYVPKRLNGAAFYDIIFIAAQHIFMFIFLISFKLFIKAAERTASGTLFLKKGGRRKCLPLLPRAPGTEKPAPLRIL